MDKIILCADIGGSHITAALIDLKSKKEIEGSWSRLKLNSESDSLEVIDSWAKTLEDSSKGHDLRKLKINIAMPGPMNYRDGVCKIKAQGKYGSLYNLNIKKLLAERLGILSTSIHFFNDAACFLKGEVVSGSLTGYNQAIGLTLGTGLGSSYFTNGVAKDSGLWKMPYQNGIAEDYISTRWFVNRFAELSGTTIKDVKDLVENHGKSPICSTLFSEFSLNLANIIYILVRKKMPFAVVLGGNIANAEVFFIDQTRRHLAGILGYSFPITKSILGEKAALIGAGFAN